MSKNLSQSSSRSGSREPSPSRSAEPEGRQTRYEIADPHLGAAMTALVEVTLAVDENAPCVDATCTVPGCCPSGTVA